MEKKALVEKIEQWSKMVVALIAAIGAVVAVVTNSRLVAIAVAILVWLLISWWLFSRIWSPSIPLAVFQTEKYRKYFVIAALLITFIVFGGWAGWQAWLELAPHPTPELEIFSPNHYGIIIAEFTLGYDEREVYPGGIELRSIMFNDLERLLTRFSVNTLSTTRVAVQVAGPIKNEIDAIDLAEKYGADLIIWGYVPSESTNVFRPSFTLTRSNSNLDVPDPVLFSNEVIAGSTIEAGTLLTKRVHAISSFLVGLAYLTDSELQDCRIASALFREAMEITQDEYSKNTEMQRDLAFNIALFSLMRGRADACLGQDEDALADYEQALKFWPDFMRAYTAIGNLYYQRGDFDNARKYYREAKLLWHGQYGLGLIAYQEGKYDEAIEYFSQALKLFQADYILPNSGMEVTIQFSLGMAFKQVGNWADASSQLWKVCNAENIPQDFRNNACIELTPSTPIPLLTSTTTPTQTPIPQKATPLEEIQEPIIMVVKGSYNIRDGPGTNFRIIDGVVAGDQILVIGRNIQTTWLVVILSDGGIGWIGADAVETNFEISDLTIIESPPTPTLLPPTTLITTKTKEPDSQPPYPIETPTPTPSPTRLPTIPPYP